MRAWAYDLMYRTWAPWNAVGVRADLRTLVESGRVSPRAHPRVVDLGCGTGASAVYLAEQGFAVTGVDFSPVALRLAERRATRAGVDCRFAYADLTAADQPGLDGPFDLVLDFGTLDDLPSAGRRAMAATVRRLVRPGGLFVCWCFYADPAALPRFSVTGPSRLAPVVLKPGEEHELFGDAFTIEELVDREGGHPPSKPRRRSDGTACFLLTPRP